MRNSCRRDQKSLPCVKGGGFAAGEDGGIANPPVCSADSPLYTRGPLCVANGSGVCYTTINSVLNKITGVCLFVLPLSLCVIDVKYSGSVICAIATVAALQESFTVITKDRINN